MPEGKFIKIGGEEVLRRTQKIYEYLEGLEDILIEFDDDVFNVLVERILVISPIHFKFGRKRAGRLQYKGGG